MLAYYKLLLVSVSSKRPQSFAEIQSVLKDVHDQDVLEELVVWYNNLLRLNFA